LSYKWGTALIRVPFPDGETSCHYCPHLRYDDGCRRNYCSLTREFIVSPFNSRGLECPVVFDNAEEGSPW
jgi:hypothetical protein